MEKFQAAVAAIAMGHYSDGANYTYLEEHVQQMIDLMRRNPDATYKGRRMIEVLSDDAEVLNAEDSIDEMLDELNSVDERLDRAVKLEIQSN